MIPLKLQLKNFLSYGSTLQTIDFSPYHLICLSGKNGHGKSALLDAITWAVWGQARKISGIAKADHHLLRLGQQQMLVIFDFEFNQQKYRIRREFAVTGGKQYASLDFALLEVDKTISLTHKTIRETQEIIETTLGIDFESFINSAFLRQGQSNEFSKKSPKERKDILGTILGLNHYELLKKRALDKVKQGMTEITSISMLQDKLRHELQRLPELTRALATLNTTLTALDAQEKQCIQQKKNLLSAKNQMLEHLNQKQALLLHINTKQEELNKLLAVLQQLHKTWHIYHKKYLYAVPVAHYEHQRKELIETIAQYQHEQQKYLELKEQELQLKKDEQTAITILHHEYAKKIKDSSAILEIHNQEFLHKKTVLEATIKQKNKVFEDIEMISVAFKTTNATLQTLSSAKQRLKQQEENFEKRRMLYRQWIHESNQTIAELKQLLHKQQLTSDETNPSCPLCEQNLSASRKKFLKNLFVHKEQFLKHRLARLETLVASLKQILTDQNEALKILRTQAEEYTKADAKLTELSSRLQTLQAEHNEVIATERTLQHDYNNLEKKLQKAKSTHEQLINNESSFITTHERVIAVRTHITQITTKLSSCTSNQMHLEQLQKRLTTLQDLIQQSELMNQEIDYKKTITLKIGELCQTIKHEKRSIHELTKQIQSFTCLEEQLQKIQTEEQHLEHTLEQQQKEKERHLEQRGSLEKEQMTLTHYQQEYAQHEKKIKELQDHIQTYQIIATALSKDGIQALIIEEALPEIEQEANELLGQLTDNQAHIIIDSLRDLKKGGTKETLDIKISDAVGIRPYELFSGGEAFRIDFALRLAISKLLARRAGTSLQTLIIDEGFGSQDEDGLHHIMDALYKIQNNFCKIIIVSHLPSMKDQFPVHFFVEKGSQGSSLRVIEQG